MIEILQAEVSAMDLIKWYFFKLENLKRKKKRRTYLNATTNNVQTKTFIFNLHYFTYLVVEQFPK